MDERGKDHVLEYAREVLGLGLLYMEFVERVMERGLCNVDAIFFCCSRQQIRNYSIEAFSLLVQHTFMRMKMQLQWSRTVNIHGRPGKNIPSDLFMEYLNRDCKFK